MRDLQMISWRIMDGEKMQLTWGEFNLLIMSFEKDHLNVTTSEKGCVVEVLPKYRNRPTEKEAKKEAAKDFCTLT